MSIYTTDFYDIMREKVAPGVGKWLLGKNELTPYWNTTVVERVSGESETEEQIMVAGVEGYGPTKEGADLPPSGQPEFFTFTHGWQKTAGTMTVTQDMMELTKGKHINVNGFILSLDSFKSGILGIDEMNMWGDGTGRVCTNVGTATGQTLVMVDVDFVRRGMYFTAVKDDVILGSNLKVNKVNPHTYVVTFHDSADLTSIADATEFFIEGTYDSDMSGAPMGFAGHLSDVDPPGGPYQGRSRAIYDDMSPVILYGSTAGIPEDYSLQRFDTFFLAIKRDIGGVIPDHGIYTHGAQSQYVSWLRTDRQPTERMPASDGYPESLYFVYGGKRIRLSAYLNAPKNKILFPHKASLKRKIAKQGGFWEPNGNMFIVVQGKMMVYVVYYSHQGTASVFPKRHGVMDDVTEVDLTLPIGP